MPLRDPSIRVLGKRLVVGSQLGNDPHAAFDPSIRCVRSGGIGSSVSMADAKGWTGIRAIAGPSTTACCRIHRRNGVPAD